MSYKYSEVDQKTFNSSMLNATGQETLILLDFYHILAEDQSQAEALAVEEYAREFCISRDFIEVISSQL